MWDLEASGDTIYMAELCKLPSYVLFGCCFPFSNKSPSTSVVEANAAALIFCEAPEMFLAGYKTSNMMASR